MTHPSTPAAAVREATFECKHGRIEYEYTGSVHESSLPLKRRVMEQVAIELLKAYKAQCIAHGLSVGILRARISQSALNYLSMDAQAQDASELAATREAALIAQCDQLRAMVEDVSKEVHVLRSALVDISEESDDMGARECALAALSAPAVEGWA